MRIFLLNKTQLYIDQTSEFAALLAYITGAHDDLKLLNGQPENELNENDQPLIGVTGVSGSGKTMLLAKLALYIEVNRNEFYWLLFYLNIL
jgi:signal recognition particle GTPase